VTAAVQPTAIVYTFDRRRNRVVAL
jgi:hypothetical protein